MLCCLLVCRAKYSAKDDLKDMECYKCHKKGNYAKKCPEIKAKDTRGSLKVQKMVECITNDNAMTKYIHQIRVGFSDLETETKATFMK